MKAIIAILFCTISFITKCQSDITIDQTYSNFYLEDSKLIWRYVYERVGMSEDSIRNMIYKNVALDNSLKVLDASDDFVIEMKEKVFDDWGTLHTGRVVIEVKEGKYRVNLSGTRFYFGSKLKSQNALFGLTTAQEPYNGRSMEENYLKNGTFNVKNPAKNFEPYNQRYIKGFDYRPTTSAKSKDW